MVLNFGSRLSIRENASATDKNVFPKLHHAFSGGESVRLRSGMRLFSGGNAFLARKCRFRVGMDDKRAGRGTFFPFQQTVLPRMTASQPSDGTQKRQHVILGPRRRALGTGTGVETVRKRASTRLGARPSSAAAGRGRA